MRALGQARTCVGGAWAREEQEEAVETKQRQRWRSYVTEHIAHFGLMYCCLSMPCQLQGNCSVLLLLCKWHLTQPRSEGG